MPSEILINIRPGTTRVALVENQVLVDFKVERNRNPTLVGSVFRGKVRKVLPGMQAAFVDIGLERAGFLYVGDVIPEETPDERLLFPDEDLDSEDLNSPNEASGLEPTGEPLPTRPKIQDLLSEGQTLMVQVSKDPLGTKGARVTTHISFPGRLLVYIPLIRHVGVSRKIASPLERERLKILFEKMGGAGGIIVRTAGEGASAEELQSDLDYLKRLWKDVQKNYDRRKTPGLIHSEPEVELRALRDLLGPEVKQVLVDDPKVFKQVSQFVTQFMPQFKNKIVHHKGQQLLFDLYDIDLEVSRSLERKIWLKSGGYLVIDEAEALTVIDVNTGRFVGKKDLEDTILKINLEACAEIAHQLRIRNCGGIIIIDFIDMEKPIHREKVLSTLEEALKSDRARTVIVGMSNLGVVEMTRKRNRPSLVATLCRACPYCEGKGYIKRHSTVSSEIFRSLEREAGRSPTAKSFLVHCHGEVADYIYEEEPETIEIIEKKFGKPIAFKVEPSYHLEQYVIYSG